MRNKKYLLKSIVYFMILVVIVSITLLYVKENEYRKNFVDNQKNEPYSQQIPLHEMDFSVYDKYFPNIYAAILVQYDKKIVLPCDIEYYEYKEDAEPALVLEKGKSVYVVAEDAPDFPNGYGLRCWPDYDKEWRYGCPFFTWSFEDVPDEYPMYYVKASQLEEVAKVFYKANEQKFKHTYYRASRFAEEFIQYIDEELYRAGAFCSEALKSR